jgi:predicted CXXCH cytochrome family protein
VIGNTILFYVFLLPFFILVSACEQGKKSDYSSLILENPATFVGHASCLECHEDAMKDWMGSDHERSMDTMSSSSVRGDFSGKLLILGGDSVRFFRQGDDYFVEAPAHDGKQDVMRIAYTFGHWPLQQYLVPFENGRLQCLPYSWDEQTGSWYFLNDSVYSGQTFDPSDWLYWTNNGQNWNAMCAECHSTDLRINYNADTRVFETSWNSINVSCEACHGPASQHIEWTNLDSVDQISIPNYGLPFESVHVSADTLLNQCVYCHSRRSSIEDNTMNGSSHYLNLLLPVLVTSEHYTHDGQIVEEDYVYASFLQSEMHRQNVSCIDCHNAHSTKLKLQGNQVCLQCHDYRDYDTKEHHFHSQTGIGRSSVPSPNGLYENGDGTQCVDCHMTGRKYMGVDFRRDHSFRIPRPDVSEKIASRDACISCHKSKNADWAMETLQNWYPKSTYDLHYGEVFYRTESGENMKSELYAIIEDTTQADMVRASALLHLGRFNQGVHHPILKSYVKSENPLFRYASSRYFTDSTEYNFKKYLQGLLNDSIASIRLMAYEQLESAGMATRDSMLQKAFNTAKEEYKSFLERSAYLPSSRFNLGVYYTQMNNKSKAKKAFYTTLDIDNQYIPAMLNLGILLSQDGELDSALYWVERALETDDENEQALLYSAMLDAEMQNYAKALFTYEKLMSINPRNSRYPYNAAMISFYNSKENLAIDYMKQALSLDPYNTNYLYGTAYIFYQTGQVDQARTVLRQLLRIDPNHPSGNELYQSLQQSMP